MMNPNLQPAALVECSSILPAPSLTLAEAWLLCRTTPQNQRGWRTLMELCEPVIRPIAVGATSRFGAGNYTDAQDLIQDIFLKITLYIRSGADALGSPTEAEVVAWVRTVAVNTIRDWARSRNASKRGAANTVPYEEHMEQLRSWCGRRQTDHAVLLAEVDGMLPDDARQRTIFWLYFRQGWTAAEIAAVPAFGLGAKGIESLLYRLTQSIRKRMGGGE
ncbi:MAG: sigma-70 family RNA polymerase sigma factor [Bryobacterales bacterium]|nr:sigma-70 family RNA polymerase sigma factor [Bryobacterales bacterium]